MVKKLLISTGLLISVWSFGQKKNGSYNIMNETNIPKIEAFLKTAHPEDPRRIPLKSKLIALKNANWTKGSQSAKPMNAKPVVLEIPKSVIQQKNNSETEEFKKLMVESSDAHKAKTVKLLNAMFDNDINRKEVILMVQNNSDCNMIVRIQGEKFYNLAVPTKGQNSVVLNKGTYTLISNVCDVKYTSVKNLSKSQLVILNNPVYDSKALAQTEKK